MLTYYWKKLERNLHASKKEQESNFPVLRKTTIMAK